MIKYILDVRDKKKLTQTLIEALDPELGITFDYAYSSWWHNLRNRGGMRLTNAGYKIFLEELELEHYNYKLEPFELDSKLMIAMDRRLQQPYYIITKKLMPVEIVFFGSKEATMVTLYGNLRKFVDNYKP